MKFLTELRWREQQENFDRDQLKILLALSDEEYTWRTLDRIKDVTRLDYNTLTDKLKDLIAGGWVRASVSRNSKEPIFGLVERVGQGKQLS